MLRPMTGTELLGGRGPGMQWEGSTRPWPHEGQPPALALVPQQGGHAAHTGCSRAQFHSVAAALPGEAPRKSFLRPPGVALPQGTTHRVPAIPAHSHAEQPSLRGAESFPQPSGPSRGPPATGEEHVWRVERRPPPTVWEPPCGKPQPVQNGTRRQWGWGSAQATSEHGRACSPKEVPLPRGSTHVTAALSGQGGSEHSVPSRCPPCPLCTGHGAREVATQGFLRAVAPTQPTG